MQNGLGILGGDDTFFVAPDDSAGAGRQGAPGLVAPHENTHHVGRGLLDAPP